MTKQKSTIAAGFGFIRVIRYRSGNSSHERRNDMEIKERWIFVLFLLFIVLTLMMSKARWAGDLIENELNAEDGKKMVGMVQNSSGESTEAR